MLLNYSGIREVLACAARVWVETLSTSFPEQRAGKPDAKDVTEVTTDCSNKSTGSLDEGLPHAGSVHRCNPESPEASTLTIYIYS